VEGHFKFRPAAPPPRSALVIGGGLADHLPPRAVGCCSSNRPDRGWRFAIAAHRGCLAGRFSRGPPAGRFFDLPGADQNRPPAGGSPPWVLRAWSKASRQPKTAGLPHGVDAKVLARSPPPTLLLGRPFRGDETRRASRPCFGPVAAAARDRNPEPAAYLSYLAGGASSSRIVLPPQPVHARPRTMGILPP